MASSTRFLGRASQTELSARAAYGKQGSSNSWSTWRWPVTFHETALWCVSHISRLQWVRQDMKIFQLLRSGDYDLGLDSNIACSDSEESNYEEPCLKGATFRRRQDRVDNVSSPRGISLVEESKNLEIISPSDPPRRIRATHRKKKGTLICSRARTHSWNFS